MWWWCSVSHEDKQAQRLNGVHWKNRGAVGDELLAVKVVLESGLCVCVCIGMGKEDEEERGSNYHPWLVEDEWAIPDPWWPASQW